MTTIEIDYNFFDWIICNDDGEDIGIRDDAPEEAKKAYEKFHKKYQEVEEEFLA